jgi:hypothetical protein
MFLAKARGQVETEVPLSTRKTLKDISLGIKKNAPSIWKGHFFRRG